MGCQPVEASGWLAAFHGRGGPLRVYIDLTTPAAWQHDRVSCVDLDLDVYELPDGTVTPPELAGRRWTRAHQAR
ncbi:DUF402 domain-containing protein [Nocardioides sp.]|uniref:DUF402 domain-containing protein n=1 Tax=Nocardioides sp. TaxID=35761 RepID=UPI0039E3388D